MAGGRQSGDVEDVLERIGHAVHHAAIVAVRDLGLGGLGGGPRHVGGDDDEGVVGRIDRGDAREQRLGVINRGELARANQLGGLRDGEIIEVAHLSPFASPSGSALKRLPGSVSGVYLSGNEPMRRPRSTAPTTLAGASASARPRPRTSASKRTFSGMSCLASFDMTTPCDAYGPPW